MGSTYQPLWLNCGWYKCTSTGYTTVQELEQHVETAHLNPKLDLFCPFKDCHDRIIRSYAAIPSHYDDVRSHPRPWTVESLLPTPFGERTRPPAEPSPIDTSSELSVPPYLISCPPVRPWPQGRPDHYVLPNRPRLRDFDVPIVPDRTDDIVFWPVCGDAPPGDLDPCTSSIFPPNKRREEQQQQQSSQREHSNKQPEQQPIIPSASRVHARPFTIRKKVEGKLGRPRLAVAADIWVAHQRKIKAKECRRLAKGKEKMVDEKDVKEEEVKEKPFDQEKIRAAAQRIAAKKVGRWIGIEFWKEVLAFEAEGVALGEIPR
ncbi:hypothetical protein CI109_106616 [Kwoniella shandongensis]|uniref:Uncharacterized protein n=1 Tax=Kwoniella shandongensis TaxID=1734106 RepID=A0A5M6BP41_9TREE|nr:uncharacterized protein CI109_007158 [Kwoniella shandongensis]KAA5524503.1 hypothetical protein CI109_007158 [Kwoniella shandongensis]